MCQLKQMGTDFTDCVSYHTDFPLKQHTTGKALILGVELFVRVRWLNTGYKQVKLVV